MPPDKQQNQNPDPLQSAIPNATPQADLPPSSSSSVGGMKVIQPTTNAVPETSNQPPFATETLQPINSIASPTPAAVQPAANVNPDMTTQPVSAVESLTVATAQPQPQSVYTQPQTRIVSRSELEAEAAAENKKAFMNKLLIFIPIVLTILVGGVVAFLLLTKSNLSRISFSSQGYTYSVLFYKGSYPYNPDPTKGGISGYKYQNSADILGLALTPGATPPAGCSAFNNSQSGVSDTRQAFTVTVNGQKQPVCTNTVSNNDRQYEIWFNEANSYHLLGITYGDTKLSTDPSTIKEILSSVNVTQN